MWGAGDTKRVRRHVRSRAARSRRATDMRAAVHRWAPMRALTLMLCAAQNPPLVFHDVPANGDCLFSAVALSAALIDNRPDQARARALRTSAERLRNQAMDLLCPAGSPPGAEPARPLGTERALIGFAIRPLRGRVPAAGTSAFFSQPPPSLPERHSIKARSPGPNRLCRVLRRNQVAAWPGLCGLGSLFRG